MYSDCCGSVAWNDDISEDGWGRCLECMEPAEFPLEQTNDEYWDCECEHDYINKKSEKVHCGWCDTNMKDQPDSLKSEVLKC